MRSSVTRIAAALATLFALTASASAHPGHSGAGGVWHDLLHPDGGLDLVLAMIAVGVFAALICGSGLARIADVRNPRGRRR